MSWYNEVMLSSMFVYQGGRTPWMVAAKAGKVEVVELLLDRGADISAADKVPSSTLCFSIGLSRVNGNAFFCKAML